MSQFIKPMAHVAIQPVSVVREQPDILVIEGVRYSGDFFRQSAYPETDLLYAIRRDGDMVILKTVRNMNEAEKFFEEIGREHPAPTDELEEENVV